MTDAMPHVLKPIADFFKSVRVTVVTLLLLAGTSILGTVVPQNKHAADYIEAFGDPMYRVLHILDITDMYNAWWFILLIVVLTLNIIFCTTSRLRTTLKVAFGKGFKGFSSLPLQSQVSLHTPLEELEPTLKKALENRFSAIRRVTTPKGFALEAEKGRWTRVGADVVHVGILVLLAGALLGSLFGFDGSVNVPEGETISAITLRDTNEKLPLGFSVRCNDFSLSHYDSGSVKEYRSSLTILENGKEILTRDIIVNKPLTYKGITFYQASYGSLGAKDFALRFTEKATGKKIEAPITLGESVSFGEGKAFTFDRYSADYAFSGKSVGEAIVGTLTQGEEAPKEVVLLSRFSNFDKMRKGEWLIEITNHKHAYYTGLQVTRDPGVGLVYAGFILMIAGCAIAFFMGHKKIRLEVTPDANGTTVALYGSAPKNRWWLKRYADQLLKGIES